MAAAASAAASASKQAAALLRVAWRGRARRATNRTAMTAGLSFLRYRREAIIMSCNQNIVASRLNGGEEAARNKHVTWRAWPARRRRAAIIGSVRRKRMNGFGRELRAARRASAW